VLHNLLDNAIRYGRPGGRVLVVLLPATTPPQRA